MTKTQTTASATFDRMESRDDFLGFGYIGGRRNALDNSDPESPAQTEQVAAADAAILAATAKWTEERLFAWANSKNGRWFVDFAFGCDDLGSAMRFLY